MTAHRFDAAVLDSGDVFWQPWMVGRDWTPADAHLPWVPLSQAGDIATYPLRAMLDTLLADLESGSGIPEDVATRLPAFAPA